MLVQVLKLRGILFGLAVGAVLATTSLSAVANDRLERAAKKATPRPLAR